MDVAALAEAAEANLFFELANLDPAVTEALGITGRRFGSGIAVSVRNDPSLFWSKAQGFGPVSADLIDAVINFYREAGTPAANFHLQAESLPADWDDIRATHSLEPADALVKLVRDNTPPTPVETSLRVARIDPSDTDAVRAWAHTQLTVFEMPDPDGLLARMLTGLCNVPAFHPYAAWSGDNLVATAALYLDGPVGQYVAAATLPGYRGQGAQSALIARRTQDALSAGCKWLAAEVVPHGRPNSSRTNLRRAGFRPLYTRPCWLWKH